MNKNTVRTENYPSNRKPKMLLLLESNFSHWKGTQRFLYEFGSYLLDHNWDVTLVDNSNSKLPDSPVKMDVKIPFPVRSAYYHTFFGRYFVPFKVIREEAPDVIYASNINAFPTLPQTRIPVIFGTHSLDISSLSSLTKSQEFDFRFKKIIFKLIVKLLWKNKDIAVHALNRDQVEWITKMSHGRIPVFNIGLPVNCDKNTPNLVVAKEKNIKFTILYFGPFSEMRGFKEFIRIVEFIEKKDFNNMVEFKIVGDGPLLPFAKQKIEFYKNVTFVIRPDDKTKNNIMLNSDLFIFPSIIETFSLGTAEAQLAGLPAIVTEIAALENIVVKGKTGYYLPLQGLEDNWYQKILEYFQLWNEDYNAYRNLRVYIANESRRLCKENVLPMLLNMVDKVASQKTKSTVVN